MEITNRLHKLWMVAQQRVQNGPLQTKIPTSVHMTQHFFASLGRLPKPKKMRSLSLLPALYMLCKTWTKPKDTDMHEYYIKHPVYNSVRVPVLYCIEQSSKLRYSMKLRTLKYITNYFCENYNQWDLWIKNPSVSTFEQSTVNHTLSILAESWILFIMLITLIIKRNTIAYFEQQSSSFFLLKIKRPWLWLWNSKISYYSISFAEMQEIVNKST